MAHPVRGSETRGGLTDTILREEVEKRYLAYALSTIVARALPDVRDGLKPVHRRILYAMHNMNLSEGARMRKSAAVVGETIGKFHPHGDQAAYDALVRMAQDFSLRYPLVDGSGNFGSLDGDAPAAMRYTETRLSAFAGLLMRHIDEGTTAFRPTYDGSGEEPDVLPAAVPNLLLNGSSGIAVGMSCSFPPHNAREVLAACRAMIRSRDLDIRGLLAHVKGPDFPTGGEILDDPAHMEEIYTTGHGSVTVRGSWELESAGRGRSNIVVTSIPYSVNKARLIERIAYLIKEKKLKHVNDVRDESTADVRIVLEYRGGEIKPESVMAFLYKHTDLQINFPINFIAITPQGVPDRLGLGAIIRHFLDFRYEKTVLRLQHRLKFLYERIHVLEGFNLIFGDLDRALAIIRSARSRKQAEQGLKDAFSLDNVQVDAVLETRLYKLVAMEISKILEELGAKAKEAAEIADDLASPDRLWKIVDNELADVAKKLGDDRRTRIVADRESWTVDYDPDEFLDHGDVTVILSRQGWIRRIKSEVESASSLKFREGDGLLGVVRVNTGRTVALFSNQGKVYVFRAMDIPASAGFGEPLGNLLTLADGECMVGMLAPDAAGDVTEEPPQEAEPEIGLQSDPVRQTQYTLFGDTNAAPDPSDQSQPPDGPLEYALLVTTMGKGFRFEYGILREPTKRNGRRLVHLSEGDAVLVVRPVGGDLLLLASDSGRVLVFGLDQVPVLSGPAQGVRMIRLAGSALLAGMEVVTRMDSVRIRSREGSDQIVRVGDCPLGNRAGQGQAVCRGIVEIECIPGSEE